VLRFRGGLDAELVWASGRSSPESGCSNAGLARLLIANVGRELVVNPAETLEPAIWALGILCSRDGLCAEVGVRVSLEAMPTSLSTDIGLFRLASIGLAVGRVLELDPVEVLAPAIDSLCTVLSRDGPFAEVGSRASFWSSPVSLSTDTGLVRLAGATGLAVGRGFEVDPVEMLGPAIDSLCILPSRDDRAEVGNRASL
jgi:hypothetical protein